MLGDTLEQLSMGIYEELGVRSLISAAGAVTNYDGSVMDLEIFEDMREVNEEFCRLKELYH